MSKDIYIVLDGVKYAQNVGPIFRLADGLGVKKIFMCRDNFQELNVCQERILHKASRGATDWVDWELKPSCVEVVEELKASGVLVVGIETGERSEFLGDIKFQFPVALVFGKEDDGISQEVMDLCDRLAKIPMLGKGRSLNISTSVSIAIYEAFKAGLS